MIVGGHVVIYSKDAEADRQFFKDVLGFPFVDAGHGWLIFALPPSEAAFHPAETNSGQELYLMCDDLNAQIAILASTGVQCSQPEETSWGSVTRIQLPGGARLGMYQPRHARPATSATR